MKRLSCALMLVVGLGGLGPSPAAEAGTVTIVLSPSSLEEARRMRVGLAVYSYRDAGLSDATITQEGDGHDASIVQSGKRNLGVVHQKGSDHEASLTQSGRRNAYGIFQFGDGAEADVSQFGNHKTGIMIQYSNDTVAPDRTLELERSPGGRQTYVGRPSRDGRETQAGRSGRR